MSQNMRTPDRPQLETPARSTELDLRTHRRLGLLT